MFTPLIDLDVVNRCGYFRLKDETGPDLVGTKWDGVDGLVSADVTEAIITITNPSGVETDIDVTTTITGASPITGDVALGDHVGTYPDGLYSLTYKIKTDTFATIAFSDYGGTVAGTVKVNATAHGQVTGEYVIISGSTNYNGTFMITYIDANNFYIVATWVADDGVAVGTRYFQTVFYPYVYCRLEAHVDRMYARIATMVPGEVKKQWEEDARNVDTLLMQIKSSISSANTTALAAIQAEATQIISFYDIDTSF